MYFPEFTLPAIISASLCAPPWSCYVSHLFLYSEHRSRNFPETDGEWRSPDLISTTLLLSPGSLLAPGQIPQAGDPQNHIISWVHTFSAWLDPAGIQPQKPWQLQDCSGHSAAHNNQQDVKLGLCRLWEVNAHGDPCGETYRTKCKTGSQLGRATRTWTQQWFINILTRFCKVCLAISAKWRQLLHKLHSAFRRSAGFCSCQLISHWITPGRPGECC